jgi:hypothetical protein
MLMSMTRDPHGTCLMPPACEHSCDDIPRELPHYFTGRVLTARDLRDEQAYLLSRLRLRHRLFHGWGVVCGLDVRPHPDPACRDRFVVVEPGIAIDCCGSDIFVCEPVVVEIPPSDPETECEPYGEREEETYENREEEDDPEAGSTERTPYGGGPRREQRPGNAPRERAHDQAAGGEPGRRAPSYAEARYRDAPGERAYREGAYGEDSGDEGSGDKGSGDGDRYQEDDDRPYGERPPRGAPYNEAPDRPSPKPDPYPEKPEKTWGPFVVCLHVVRHGIEPRPVLDDPSGCDARRSAPTRVRDGFRIEVVPRDALAPECWPSGDSRGDRDCDCRRAGATECFEPDCPCGDCVPLALLTGSRNGPAIDIVGRREVVNTLRRHTRIRKVNWPHGGSIHPSYLRDRMGGALRVDFTAPIAPADRRAGTGISRFTFEVTLTGVQLNVEFLPTDRDPYLSEDGCSAFYPLSRGLLGKIEGLGFKDLMVRLRGDFILDTDGRPIDADFLRGRFPTGNGTAGGTFESWFSTDATRGAR